MWEVGRKTKCEMYSCEALLQKILPNLTVHIGKKLEEFLPNLTTILNVCMLLPMTSCEVGRSHSNNNNHHQCLVILEGGITLPFFSLKKPTRLFIISKVIKDYAAKKHRRKGIIEIC